MSQGLRKSLKGGDRLGAYLKRQFTSGGTAIGGKDEDGPRGKVFILDGRSSGPPYNSASVEGGVIPLAATQEK